MKLATDFARYLRRLRPQNIPQIQKLRIRRDHCSRPHSLGSPEPRLWWYCSITWITKDCFILFCGSSNNQMLRTTYLDYKLCTGNRLLRLSLFSSLFLPLFKLVSFMRQLGQQKKLVIASTQTTKTKLTKVSLSKFIMQCPPLNRITLGQHKSDKNNRMIQLTDVVCVLLRYTTVKNTGLRQ